MTADGQFLVPAPNSCRIGPRLQRLERRALVGGYDLQYTPEVLERLAWPENQPDYASPVSWSLPGGAYPTHQAVQTEPGESRDSISLSWFRQRRSGSES